MSLDTSIPGYTELYDWLIVPVHPVRIVDFGRYRDGGPQGGTFFVDLEDANQNRIPFFFDRFLGRLCYGSTYESGEDAAFLRSGSRLEKEAFDIIDSLARSSAKYEEILKHLDQAKTWTQIS